MIIEKVVDKDEMIRDLKLFKKYYLLPFKSQSLVFLILIIYGAINFLFAYLFSIESKFIDISMIIVALAILYYLIIAARTLIKTNKEIKKLINDRTKIYNTRDYIIRRFTFTADELIIEKDDGTNQVTDKFLLDDLYIVWIDKKRKAFIMQFKTGKNRRILAVYSDKIDELETYFIKNNIRYHIVKR